jgi:L-fucose mutarotase
MLKGIPAILGPDLLWAIAAMGHGDGIAIVDRNCPAHSLNKRVITLAGVDAVAAARAITSLLPIDDFVEPSAYRMTPDGKPDEEFPVHRDVRSVVSGAENRQISFAGLERTHFYDMAKEAFAIVVTTDIRPYACFLLTKGVVRGDIADSKIGGHGLDSLEPYIAGGRQE